MSLRHAPQHSALRRFDKPDDGAIVSSLPGELTTTALMIREGLGFGEWEAVGQTLQRVERSVRWWVGDWLNYGERMYGDTYTQAVEATGRKVQDLMNMRWVSSRVDPSRRRENLSWSAHAAVASLEPAEQELWLQRAEEESWSSDELRRSVRLLRNGSGSAKSRACRECGDPCAGCASNCNQDELYAPLVAEFGDRRVIESIVAWASKSQLHAAMRFSDFARIVAVGGAQ